MIRLPSNLIMKLKNEGKRLSYGREIKYHRSTAKYPVLDRNVVSGGFSPHMLYYTGWIAPGSYSNFNANPTGLPISTSL